MARMTKKEQERRRKLEQRVQEIVGLYDGSYFDDAAVGVMMNWLYANASYVELRTAEDNPGWVVHVEVSVDVRPVQQASNSMSYALCEAVVEVAESSGLEPQTK